jgi:hypothetical protein
MKQGYFVVGLAALFFVEAAQRPPSTSIEIEDLAASAKASAGRVDRQDMRGFGRGWSGNAQLFWGAPPPVDKPIRNWPHLSVSFAAPNAETYEVILHYTSAPDFATFRVFLDGQPVGDIDGYGPAVAPQTRGLGQHNLSAAKHELLVTVFGKAGASKGFSVGLDRIELQPAGATPLRGTPQTRAPGGGTQAVSQPAAPPPAAQLNFAAVSSITQKWTEKSGTEQTFDRPNLTAHLVWESASAGKLAWRWQVALQPFSGPVSLAPAGLVAQHEVSTPAFTIDLGSLPPLSGRSAQGTRPSTVDFHIRLVAIAAGQPAGASSNVVVAHFVPGSDQSAAIAGEAIKKDHDRKVLDAALKAMSTLYTIEVLSFKPAMFADPNRWGCVVILKNPHASGPGFNVGGVGHELSRYGPGEHCGRSYSGQGHTLTPWDYITGWAKAYEIVSKFYDEAKAWAATQFANTLPCDMLGKAADDCKKYGEQLAGVAINAGLVAAGVPPSLPDLNEAAKGKAVEVGVSLTCDAIESNGGKCSPELEKALAKAYGAGLDKLEHELDRTTKEPGCGSAAEAHSHGREPLPCFGDYPEVEFKPADGAVYQPPMVTVRVTRKGRGLSDLARSDYELRAHLSLRNHFAGGQIESYYDPVPPTDLSGELFAPGTLTLPSLGMGQSATVTLQMGGIQQYTFSSTKGGYAKHNGWCALYNGGSGSVTVTAMCRNANGAPVSCGLEARRTIQLPKDYKCSIG